MSKSRIKWIDIAKGITILIVVLGHISSAYIRRTGYATVIYNNSILQILFNFEMPVFFFLSGLFIDHLLKRSFKNVLISRFKRLMIPYFIWGIISIIFYSLYLRTFPLNLFVELPIRPIFVLWFLYSLFICDIVFYLLKKVIINNDLLICVISLFICVFGYLIPSHINVPIDSTLKIIIGAMQGFFFVFLGFMYKNRESLRHNAPSYMYIIFILVSFILSRINILFNNVLLNFINMLLGIIIITSISKILNQIHIIRYFNKIISFIGLISMQIYVMHKIIVEVFSLIIVKYISNFYLYAFISLILTIIVCYIIVISTKKISWILFGAKHN